jgi:hypothetical protein
MQLTELGVFISLTALSIALLVHAGCEAYEKYQEWKDSSYCEEQNDPKNT